MENPTAEDWGRLYVSGKCINAGTCRNIAPELLAQIVASHSLLNDSGRGITGPPLLRDSHDQGAFTGVVRQPRTKQEYFAARTAAAACPFSAIRLQKPTGEISPEELGDPWRDWPRRIEDNVWVLGYSSMRNAGATAYFIERRGGGIVVDLPKPSEQLFRWLDDHGSVRWLFLTHRDHVQHHAEFAARFPQARRVMSAADVNRRKGSWAEATDAVEVQLGNGPGPMTLEGTPIPLEALADAELAVLPQPGHTPGSLCLLYRGRFLFTGDHLQYSRRIGQIFGSRLHCWYDWELQCDSLSQLADWAEAGRLRFQWLLPGHGEWHRFGDDGSGAVITKEFKSSLEWMRRQPPGKMPMRSWFRFIMTRMNPSGRIGRFVLAIGGEGGDAWVLPRACRKYLTNYDPAKTDAAMRRVYTLGAAALAAVSLLIWLAIRMI